MTHGHPIASGSWLPRDAAKLKAMHGHPADAPKVIAMWDPLRKHAGHLMVPKAVLRTRAMQSSYQLRCMRMVETTNRRSLFMHLSPPGHP